MSHSNSADIVRSFFDALGAGRLDDVASLFAPEANITAVRASERRPRELYGTYVGRAGIRELVTTLGEMFRPRAFVISDVIADGEIAYASGTFTQSVIATGKLFHSDWALRCIVRDGAIHSYQFFEDSAALLEATRA